MRTDHTGTLLGAAQGGSSRDLGDLLEHLRPRIVLWAATRLSPALRARIEAEDVAQLVLLAVHRDFDRFHGRSREALLAWVFAVGENRIRDLARRFGARKRTPGGVAESEASLQSLEEDMDRAHAGRHPQPTTPSQAADRAEALEGMRAALVQLGAREQSVLRLRDLEMRSYEEVAEAMGLDSPGAARTLRCRALVALRQAMRDGATL